MTESTRTINRASSAPSQWRSIGFWMSLFLIAYILFNSVRATVNPAAFATSFGVPATYAGSAAFVLVYAIRALFLGLLGAALLLRRNFEGLALFVLVSTVMPLGDAALVASVGGPTSTVVRHLFIALFLLTTWFLLRRWIRQTLAAGNTMTG